MPLSNKKKKIVIAVSVFYAILFGFLGYYFFAEEDSANQQEASLNFEVPEPDEAQLKDHSKLKLYDQEKGSLNFDLDGDPKMSNLEIDASSVGGIMDPTPITGTTSLPVLGETAAPNRPPKIRKKEPKKLLRYNRPSPESKQPDQEEEMLRDLITTMEGAATQHDQQFAPVGNGLGQGQNPMAALKNHPYGDLIRKYADPALLEQINSYSAPGINPVHQNVLKEPEKEEAEEEEEEVFFSVGDGKQPDYVIKRAEILEDQHIRHGQTVNIRVLESFVIDGVKVPKGTVIYGIATFQSDRVNVAVNNFFLNGRQKSGKITAIDYDGRDGIHLNERVLYEIPSNISKDIYNLAEQTYTQQNPLTGGGDRVPIKEAALLSASKELFKELNALKVSLHAGYIIWLKVEQE